MAAAPDLRRATAIERQPIASEASTTQSLYERYAGQIYGFCFNQLGSREEAEDAVQSTFMNAFRGLQRGVVPEAESAWLFKIAHNVCLSRRRAAFRRGRVEFANDLEALQEITPSPTSSRSADDLIRLNDVLATMPENQRKAILLREWQGLSYHEIGAEMELSQAAVETLIFRARRSLAAGLEAAEAPKKGWKRLRTGSNLGSLLVGLKSLLAGSAAVVAAGSVAAGGPLEHHFSRTPAAADAHPARARATAPERARAHVSAFRVDTARGETPRTLAARQRPPVAKQPQPAAAPRHARVAPRPASVHATPAAPAPVAPVVAATPPPPPVAQTEPPVREPAAAAPAPPPPAADDDKGKDHGKRKEERKPKEIVPPPPPAAQTPPPPPPAADDDQHTGDGKGHGRDQGKGKDKEKDSAPAAATVPPTPVSDPADDASHGHGKGNDDGSGSDDGKSKDKGNKKR